MPELSDLREGITTEARKFFRGRMAVLRRYVRFIWSVLVWVSPLILLALGIVGAVVAHSLFTIGGCSVDVCGQALVDELTRQQQLSWTYPIIVLPICLATATLIVMFGTIDRIAGIKAVDRFTRKHTQVPAYVYANLAYKVLRWPLGIFTVVAAISVAYALYLVLVSSLLAW